MKCAILVGVTPEARSLEDARGNKPLRGEFTITQEDYEESRRQICSAGEGKINFVLMGCPHYSLEDIQQVANYIEGKKVAEGVELHVWTDMSTLAMAKASGFVKTIEEAGGNVLSSSCCYGHGSCSFCCMFTAMVTDSGKQGHYMHSCFGAGKHVPIYYGDIYQCIDAAAAGYWKGEA